MAINDADRGGSIGGSAQIGGPAEWRRHVSRQVNGWRRGVDAAVERGRGTAIVPIPAGALSQLVARYRRHVVLAVLGTAAETYLAAYRNENWDGRANGEQFLLNALRRAPDRGSGDTTIGVVFDVGAFLGHWAIMAIEAFPESAIHAFEIARPLHKALENNLACHPSATVHRLGLGDRSGAAEVFYSPDGPSATSVFSGALRLADLAAVRLSGALEKGDVFCSDSGIERVDLLKLDVEGAELDVLLGFGDMLAEKRIGVIQFEYGPMTLGAGRTLKSHYELLNSYDYRIGKLYPNYVEFGDYRSALENFRYANFLAVPASHVELIDFLRGSRNAYRGGFRSSLPRS